VALAASVGTILPGIDLITIGRLALRSQHEAYRISFISHLQRVAWHNRFSTTNGSTAIGRNCNFTFPQGALI